MDHAGYLAQLKHELELPTQGMLQLAEAFRLAMREGLEGRSSSLKMLPSFIGIPSGHERGAVLAIDFGGTNVRVLEAELDGAGTVHIRVLRSVPLVDPKGSYNHVDATAEASALFGFIADHLGEIARPGVAYNMGHTFSFPCEQHGLNDARLIYWTKEFRTRGVEGSDIGALMNAALASRGLQRIRQVAIINDTVGTQLAAAYSRPNVRLGSICGTGHNTCYLEEHHPLTGAPMIVNMESGNFDGAGQSRFDLALDQASERPGTQRLEKMVSGHYLGEIVRLILCELGQLGLLPESSVMSRKQLIGGIHLSRIVGDWGDLPETARVAQDLFGWQRLGLAERACLHTVALLVARRSARLVAATFLGAVRHMDPELKQPHVVAIDGSLYEKMPHYAGWLQQALNELTPGAPDSICAILTKDGSGLGAAIAAGTQSGQN